VFQAFFAVRCKVVLLSCAPRLTVLLTCDARSLLPSLPFSHRDIGEAINVVTKAARCSIVTTYCGHGIGELFHTSPNVPHYPKNKAKGAMQPGHIFTIEPMINLGNYRCVLYVLRVLRGWW
jgi:Xaa-Pro aminopeptidase